MNTRPCSIEPSLLKENVVDGDKTLGQLRLYNVGIGLLHAVQGAGVVVLSVVSRESASTSLRLVPK